MQSPSACSPISATAALLRNARLLLGVAVFLLAWAGLDARGYRVIKIPQQWQFQNATPAYNPQTGDRLGEFQRGIRVDVIGTDAEADKWLVRYRNYGSPDVDALIDWPEVSQSVGPRWPQIEAELGQTPLLRRLLSHSGPWSQDTADMIKNYLIKPGAVQSGTKEKPLRLQAASSEDVGRLWGLLPTFVILDTTGEAPGLIIEVWNKADGIKSLHTFPGASPHRAFLLLQEKLENLSRQLGGTDARAQEDANASLSIVREQRTLYPLANHTTALLRYQRNEYLILELRPFTNPETDIRQSENAASQQPSIARASLTSAETRTLLQSLAKNITTDKKGYRYLESIPMIDQGSKGYCVAATLARVLQYYGYSVDMHQMADLASTEREGTSYRDMVRAMYRTCGTTPFRFTRLRSRDVDELKQVSIDRGLPLIWVIPRHVRLITGFHEDGKSIVYSDSWGPGHEFKTMPVSDFKQMTVDIFLMDI